MESVVLIWKTIRPAGLRANNTEQDAWAAVAPPKPYGLSQAYALLASKRGEQRQEFTTDNTEQDAWIVRAKTATEGVFAIKQEAKKSEGSRTFGFVT